MPNTFAYVALFGFPLVVVHLFRRLPRDQALIWSVFSGYLLLPFAVGIKLPMVPAFDKTLIPVLSATVMLFFIRPHHKPERRRAAEIAAVEMNAGITTEAAAAPGRAAGVVRAAGARRRNGDAGIVSGQTAVAPAVRTWRGVLINLLLVLLMLGPFLTVMQNSDPMQIGAGDRARVLRGLQLYDSFSMISGTLVAILPFLLARRYLASPASHVHLVRIFALAALAYTLPTLYEIRMSPQLSRMIYGFLAQSFGQAFRDNGWRPVVFLQQGLWLALFMAMAALAAFALWRQERSEGRRSRWVLAGAYLAVVLVLCHSLGALGEFLLFAPLVLLIPVRGQLLFASAVAAVVLTYPMLRGADLVPVKPIYEFVRSDISQTRAESFWFRIRNENMLLAHADRKPLVGWGGWGRSRVYGRDANDISTTDGMWIIVVGVSGWLGYIATFGLIGGPILLLAARDRRLGISPATAGLCLLLAANLLDMLMNGTLTPVTWLVAGALAGRASQPALAASELSDTGAGRRRQLVRTAPSHGPIAVRGPALSRRRPDGGISRP